MQATGVKTLVFSSSATFYGESQMPLLTEDYPLGATNAYGRSKTIIKDMPSDLFEAESDGRIGLLCYFNPVGVHPRRLIGKNPTGYAHKEVA